MTSFDELLADKLAAPFVRLVEQLEQRMTDQNPRLVYTSTELADALGVSVRHIDTLARADRIPYVWIGQARRYPVAAINAWLLTGARSAAPTDTPPGPEASASTGEVHDPPQVVHLTDRRKTPKGRQ